MKTSLLSSFSNIITLTKRNLKLYFRNKSAVFFSFLSPLIVLGLYVLFLKQVQLNSIEVGLNAIEGVLFNQNAIAFLIDSWLVAGVIGISMVTVVLGSSYIIVIDKERDIKKDYIASPIANWKVLISYFFSVFLIGVIITFTMLCIGDLYLFLTAGSILTIIQTLQIIGVILLGLVASTLFFVLLISFVKNMNAYSLVSTIVGTLIGFLTGAYMPLSMFPTAVQTIANCFSFSHHAALLRNIFMNKPLAELLVNMPAETVQNFQEVYSLNLYIGNLKITPVGMVAFIAVSALILFTLNVIRFRKN